MSTKKIREALLSHGVTHDVSEALAEVEAIERRESRLLPALRDVLEVGNAQTVKGIDAWNHARKVASEYP